MDSYASAYGAIGAATINGLTTLANNALTYKESKALANYQNQLALENWYLQTDYNAPKNQMYRLEEAGINPNLAYSNGSISNTASSAPDAHAVGDASILQGNSKAFSESINTGLQFLMGLIGAQKSVDERNLVHYNAEMSKIQAMRDFNQYILDFYGKDAIDMYDSPAEAFTLDSGNSKYAPLSLDFADNSPLAVSSLDKHNLNLSTIAKMSQEISNLQMKNVLTDTEIQNLQKDLEIKGLKVDYQDLQNQYLSETLRLLTTYGDAEAIANITSKIVGSATDIVGSVTKAKTAKKAIRYGR